MKITLTNKQANDLKFILNEFIKSDMAEDYHKLFKSVIKKIENETDGSIMWDKIEVK
ncbi:hypothetical protein [Flavobacterium capsici]|uniref:Uncharacterized protein n=1 Tax=Flavobacterium capsici TaxID=3075618 RepID=A0AA96F2E7_9FLAO|nr:MULTISPECIES: hypothetical protein [unclassified Flavobacterium]WNM18636.1 hypothetical protein RN608_11520 [Flavobacterium sp. PMR2A8]WNM22687.1 hypothetical protein RN605_04820 [Flavobacterium sp. PMTSA4]